MKLLAILGAVGCFGSFVWGMECFFTRPGGKTGGERLIRGLGLVFVPANLWQLWGTQPEGAAREFVGLGLYALAAALFWWAVAANRKRPLAWAFQAAKPEHLVRTGPYRLVRHPFYTSYISAWAAGAVFAGSLGLGVAAATMSVIYATAAAEEERGFAVGPLAAPHAGYRKRTGAFFPKLLSLGARYD